MPIASSATAQHSVSGHAYESRLGQLGDSTVGFERTSGGGDRAPAQVVMKDADAIGPSPEQP